MPTKYANCSTYLLSRSVSQERGGGKVRCVIYKANEGLGRDEHCVYRNIGVELETVGPDRQLERSRRTFVAYARFALFLNILDIMPGFHLEGLVAMALE